MPATLGGVTPETLTHLLVFELLLYRTFYKDF